MIWIIHNLSNPSIQIPQHIEVRMKPKCNSGTQNSEYGRNVRRKTAKITPSLHSHLYTSPLLRYNEADNRRLSALFAKSEAFAKVPDATSQKAERLRRNPRCFKKQILLACFVHGGVRKPTVNQGEHRMKVKS